MPARPGRPIENGRPEVDGSPAQETQEAQASQDAADEPIPDDEHLSWLCPKCRTTLVILDYRSWVDGSPQIALECPNCHWVQKD